MEEHLKNRLLAMRDRLKVVDELLLDANVLSDSRQFKALSKERSFLDDVVSVFNRYEENERNYHDALLMKDDKDEEIAALGKSETERIEKEQITLLDQIKVLLITARQPYGTGQDAGPFH